MAHPLPLPATGFVRLLLPLVALVLVLGCGERTGYVPDAVALPPGDDAASGSAASDGASSGGAASDGTAADSVSAAGAEAGSELLDDWVEAPAGFCDDPAHTAHVTWVKDGDTVSIDWPNPVKPDEWASVRYIGVAASEIGECFSYECKDTLESLVPPNGTVCLRKENGSADYDMYGRYLRWVFFRLNDGRWVLQNQRLVRLGAARAYHQYLSGRLYEKEILAAEKAAMAENLGGWSKCGW